MVTCISRTPTAKILCTLDYFYSLYNRVDVSDRNPWSVSSATGTYPACRSLANGLFWEKMISGGVKNKNLYYAKELSERVFDGSESLYDADVKSQKIDVSAFTFGVAMAFVVDEALGRHVSEDYWIYTALFGRTHTSEEAHEVLWSFVSTRRQCDIPHTAMRLVFGRRVYSLMIQGMDFFNRVFRGSNNCYDELVVAGSSHVKAEFDQVDACGRVYPFMRLKAADFQDQDANKRGLAVLGYERSIMSSVPDKIDLDKAYTLYKSYVDDWLYYLYTPHSTTFPKAGVGNLPHTTDHEINFLTPALGNSTYSTHSCQPWSVRPKDLSFTLRDSTNNKILALFYSPADALKVLLTKSVSRARVYPVWILVFHSAVKAVPGATNEDVVDAILTKNTYKSIFHLIVANTVRTAYVYGSGDAVEQVKDMKITPEMRRLAINVTYACCNYDWLDFCLEAHRKGYLGRPVAVVNGPNNLIKFTIAKTAVDEENGRYPTVRHATTCLIRAYTTNSPKKCSGVITEETFIRA